MTQEKPLRIILADDHQIFREGLRTLLEKQPGTRVVGEAADGREAVRLTAERQPHLVIMDISMPVMNGIEASRQILADHPETLIVGLSMHADCRFVLETLKAGARGYLLKDSAFEELAAAIREVRLGRIYLSPAATDLVVRDFLQREQPARAPGAFGVLSSREREVLQLIAEGRSTKEIAADLGISAKTVETHRKQIMHKLKLFSIAELTKYAIREGLTPP